MQVCGFVHLHPPPADQCFFGQVWCCSYHFNNDHYKSAASALCLERYELSYLRDETCWPQSRAKHRTVSPNLIQFRIMMSWIAFLNARDASLKLNPPLAPRLPIVRPKPGERAAPVKTMARSATILPNFVGLKFQVHNGKIYNDVTITEDMVGHKLGEFSPWVPLVSRFWELQVIIRAWLTGIVSSKNEKTVLIQAE